MGFCAACANALRNPYFCDFCQASSPACDPGLVEDARQRSLGSEAGLRALGFWFQVDGVLVTLVALALFQSLWFNPVGYSSHRGSGGLAVLALGPAWAAIGYFLYRFSERARVAALIAYLVSMVGWGVQQLAADPNRYSPPTPTTTIFAVIAVVALQLAVFAFLLSKGASRVCAPAYRDMAARTSRLKTPYWRSPWFGAFAVLHGLALFVALIVVPEMVRHHRY
jgi:hypothetical protein